MAFLVCYSRSPPDDHAQRKAIYLDQRFYEMIFTHCLPDRTSYAALSEIASLRYKSPTLVIAGDRLQLLAEELRKLEVSGQSHLQIGDLRMACARARADGCALTISGDMYPEL